MQTTPAAGRSATETEAQLAHTILFSFLLTFIAARIMVFLIMSRSIPSLYLHVQGAHVHHLNYGIFLLSGLGAFLIFKRPQGRMLTAAAVVYGFSLALTFDEFGMWVRLGGSYWQRASWDAVCVLAALFGVIAYAPEIKKFRPHHWWSAAITLTFVVVFFFMLVRSFDYAGNIVGPRLLELELSSPQ